MITLTSLPDNLQISLREEILSYMTDTPEFRYWSPSQYFVRRLNVSSVKQ